jgi:MFS family permease
MLPLGLFKRRAFTGVQVAAFAVSVSLFALFLYLTLYLQDYLHYSPLQAGLRYLPITIGSFIAAPVAGALLSRVHARVLMSLGLLGTGVGLILMSNLDAGSGWTALLPGFIAAGLGVGLLNPVVADVALSVVPKERSGMASGINDTFRQVGVAVGVAAWGAIFLSRGSSRISNLVAGTPVAGHGRPRQLLEALTGGHLSAATRAIPNGAHELAVSATRDGFLTGLNAVLLIGGIVAVVGAGLALWLVREHEIERDEAKSPAPTAGALAPTPA